MKKFSLSPSSIGLWRESPLLFYFSYIEGREPDSVVPTHYGNGGQVVHLSAEKYSKESGNIYEYFEHYWRVYKLDEQPKTGGKPLNKKQYLDSVIRCKKIIDSLPKINPEEKTKYLLLKDDNFEIYCSGIVDGEYVKDGKIILIDWKTNSKVHEQEHRMQALHYVYQYYKIKNKIPYKVVFYYVKINSEITFKFSEIELLEYEKFLKNLALKISSKGLDINKYELGKIDGFFNVFKKACLAEKLRRDNSTQENELIMTIKNNTLFFENMPTQLQNKLQQMYTYVAVDNVHLLIKTLEKKLRSMPSNTFASDKIKNTIAKLKHWDGKKCLIKKNSMPLAFMNSFEKVVDDYNSYFKKDLKIKYIDLRDERVLKNKFNITFGQVPFELYYYQKEAVEKALEKKFGILALGTSAGKTAIAGEILKRLLNRSLLLVDRVQLARQTAKDFSKYLGIEVGLMTEGNLDIEKPFTVASIQTVVSILESKKKEKDKLIKYLYNLNTIIFDECHTTSDSKRYSVVQRFIPNVEYCLGLTGTPWRTDGATLEMNALVGFPIYEKQTKELQDEGFISDSKVVFFEIEKIVRTFDSSTPVNTFLEVDFDEKNATHHEIYDNYIVNNEKRNSIICEIYNKIKKDKKILLLVNRVNHRKLLKKLIPEAREIGGDTSKKKRQEIFDEITNSKEGIIIGMISIMSTGINLPSLDIGLNVSGNKSDIVTIQSIGRYLRKSENKKYGIFIDFFDYNNYFYGNSIARKKILKNFGHDIKMFEDVNEGVKYINKLIN